MNTAQVAELLGTTSRKLRIFLRSDESTFAAVGSGARYDFTEADLPALRRRWAAYSGSNPPAAPEAPRIPITQDVSRTRDELVWEEEGVVPLADIRDPRVRAHVRRVAKEQERRLEIMLLAAGLHITQMGVRPPKEKRTA